jgi:uncharacterized protein (DUF305 family)
MFFDPEEEHIHGAAHGAHGAQKHVNTPDEIRKRYYKIWTKLLDPLSSLCSSNNDHISIHDFLVHMMEHHQVAVDMCNKLLKSTKNTTMMAFAGEIIRAQQYEIWYMKNLLGGFYQQSSKHLKYIRDKEKCCECNNTVCRRYTTMR